MWAQIRPLHVASASAAVVTLWPCASPRGSRHRRWYGHNCLSTSQLLRCEVATSPTTDSHGPDDHVHDVYSADVMENRRIPISATQEYFTHVDNRKVKVILRLADVVHNQAGRYTFDDIYVKGNLIGEGGFGKVWLAKHRLLGHEVAVKTMDRRADEDHDLFEEIDTLLQLDHPHIVKLIAYFQETYMVHLVFEVCRGPELYEILVAMLEKGETLPEWDAAMVMRHMLKAIRGCHTNFMGHYDIKPENFMYAGQDLENLKMIDLGASSTFKKSKRLNIGTPEYMAPEFHDGIYGPAGDVFSAGVVFFVMLTGELFFPADEDLASLNEFAKDRKWMQRRIYEAQLFHQFSDEALDLMVQMLRLDRHRRISVQDALSHPFMAKAVGHERTSSDDRGKADEGIHLAIDHFRRFSAYPVVKRAGRLILAHILPRILARGQRLAFRTMDRDGFGEMSAEALETVFEESGMQIPDDFDEIVKGVDVSCSGYINFHEFLAASLPAVATRDPSYCQAVFNILDADGDGVITASDLNAVFRSSATEAWSEALQEVCPDSSSLTWNKFRVLMEVPSQSWS